MGITSTIYLIEILGNINCALYYLLLIGIIPIIISSIVFIHLCDDYEESNLCNTASIILKKSWILLIILFIAVFIPSKNSMYLMLGSKYLSQSQLPTKVEKALSLKIDEYILEMEKNLISKKD